MDPVYGKFPLLYIVYFSISIKQYNIGHMFRFFEQFLPCLRDIRVLIDNTVLSNLKINNERSKMLILKIFIVCYHHR